MTIAEDLILLALDSRTGATLPAEGAGLDYGLAAAALAELCLLGRLDVVEGGYVAVADPDPCGDTILDAVLERVRRHEGPRGMGDWVSSLGRDARSVRDPAVARLVSGGALRREERRLLGLIPLVRYRATAASPRGLVRGAVLEGRPVDHRARALLGLAWACHLGNALFAPEERREALPRLKALAASERAPRGVRHAVEAAQGAVDAAMIAVLVAASSAGAAGRDGGGIDV